MKVTTVGIDLAKNVFQLHGVNEAGRPVIKKQLRRDQVTEFFINLPACLIGMEACGSAHYWARKLEGFGHAVKLIAPQFVKPYVKTTKTMQPMLRRSVRRLHGQTCALCQSKILSSKACCLCTVYGRVL